MRSGRMCSSASSASWAGWSASGSGRGHRQGGDVRDEAAESVRALNEVVERLRAPGGCPWDREQTHRTLRPYLLEETYKALGGGDGRGGADGRRGGGGGGGSALPS